MNCDELERKIEECCERILNRIGVSENYVVAEVEETENNLKNLIDIFRNLLNQDIQDIQTVVDTVEQQVTIDISGTTNTKYECAFPLDKDGNIEPGYAQSNSKEIDYSGSGLVGLHHILNIIMTNLNAIHNDVCKAVDPIQTITLEDLYNFCDDSGIKREDFPDTPLGEQEYVGALNTYFYELQKDSKYGYLISEPAAPSIENGNVTSGVLKLIEAPTNWLTFMIADFALIQSRINRNQICNIDIPEHEPGEVVAIVASDKVLDRATGKLLVLHLVTFENYPKRSRNSTYWQVQIPQAKQTYDWDEDFKDLVWNRGNLYCEMYFDGIKDPVSGFFADKNAANSWFDSILSLTTATERNRKYHEQQNLSRNILPNITRPYRAYITSVSDAGRAVIEVKFVPPINNNET